MLLSYKSANVVQATFDTIWNACGYDRCLN